MKVLLIKSAHCVSEEGGSGTSEYAEMPAQMILAAQYLSDLGFNVTMRDIFEEEEKQADFGGYHATVSWVPIIGKYFYKGINFLEQAKKTGQLTVMVLNDAYEGMERECLERYPFIDYAVRLHERELVLGKLFKSLDAGRSPKDLAGILFRKGNEIVDNGLHPQSDNLYHLKAADHYLKQLPLKRYSVGKLDVARGCPFQCIFCQYQGTRRRRRQVEDILKELIVIQGFYHLVWLHELNMMIDRDFTVQLCQGIIDSGIQVNWSTDARMGSCDDLELLSLMKQSGCGSLDFGLECVNEEIRNDMIKKRISNGTIEMAITNCLKTGIRPSINLMLGTPWESEDTMKETEAFLKKYPYVDNIQLARPQRGTPLYDIYRDEGLLKRELHLEDYIASRDYPLCSTKYLSREELFKWYWRFSIKVISRHAVIRLNRLGWKKFISQIVRKKFKPYYLKLILQIAKDFFTSQRSPHA